MKIRITGGILKGMIIDSPEVNSTHPMGAREKIALFNMLTGHLAGAKVLDAYAGSGALGIEAISRGATEVVMVEKNPRVVAILKHNLQKLGLEDMARVEKMSVEQFVKNGQCWQDEWLAKKRNEVQSSEEQGSGVAKNAENCCIVNNFDIILADPPYDRFDVATVAKLAQFLALEGILALSHPDEAPELPGLNLQKTHAYARARISIYARA